MASVSARMAGSPWAVEAEVELVEEVVAVAAAGPAVVLGWVAPVGRWGVERVQGAPAATAGAVAEAEKGRLEGLLEAEVAAAAAEAGVNSVRK